MHDKKKIHEVQTIKNEKHFKHFEINKPSSLREKNLEDFSLTLIHGLVEEPSFQGSFENSQGSVQMDQERGYFKGWML